MVRAPLLKNRKIFFKYLIKPFSWNQLQLNGLHSSNISETHFWNIQSTNDMGPAGIVCLFKGSIFAGTQLTLLKDSLCVYIIYNLIMY